MSWNLERDSTYLIDGLRVDCVVGTRDLSDALHNTIDRRVPSVVILRCQSCYGYATAIKVVCQRLGTEQLGQGEAVAFNPIFGGQINGWEDGSTRICHGRHNEWLRYVCQLVPCVPDNFVFNSRLGAGLAVWPLA